MIYLNTSCSSKCDLSKLRTRYDIIDDMNTGRRFQYLRLALFGLFTLFTFNASHLTIPPSSMAGMDMGQHNSMSPVECKVLCTTAIIAKGPVALLERQQNDNESTELAICIVTALLSALAVSFVVKILISLSSWRPPDRVLLYGHYSTGL